MIKPLVSVIIPTYSRPVYLRRAIDSVYSQTWPKIEIIVVDDNGEGSRNQLMTKEEVSLYVNRSDFMYLVHTENCNGAQARNTGVKASSGNYVTFLDDDDELMPNKIEMQLRVLLNSDSSYGAVYSGFVVVNQGRILRTRRPKLAGNLQLNLLQLSWGFGTGSNPMFRRSVFESIGGFDKSFVRHQDWEFMVRFFRKFEILKDDTVSVIRHVDSTQNLPNPTAYVTVKKHFLDTFEEDIQGYSPDERLVIYRNQYADVAFNALIQNDIKLALRYYWKATLYKVLSSRIILKGLFYFITRSRVR